MKIQYKSKELIIFESALFRTTTSLPIGKDFVLLADPNLLPEELDFIKNTVDQLPGNKKKYMVFTHSDWDHIIGYGLFQDYTTIASEYFIKNTEKEKIIDQIKKFDDEYYITRNYAIEYPKIDIIVHEPVRKICFGSEEFIFFQAPGHNQDGIITYNESSGILICGDYLSNMEFPFVYTGFELYKNSLSLFENIVKGNAVKLLIPGHGDMTEDKNEMMRRINDSQAYISELEDSVRNNTPFDTAKLFSRYKFPITLRRYHEDNIKVLKKELGLG